MFKTWNSLNALFRPPLLYTNSAAQCWSCSSARWTATSRARRSRAGGRRTSPLGASCLRRGAGRAAAPCRAPAAPSRYTSRAGPEASLAPSAAAVPPPPRPRPATPVRSTPRSPAWTTPSTVDTICTLGRGWYPPAARRLPHRRQLHSKSESCNTFRHCTHPIETRNRLQLFRFILQFFSTKCSLANILCMSERTNLFQ